MNSKYDYFVIFAGMRTGSNFLENNINQFDGVECLGEVFNPAFVGFPNQENLYGFDVGQRDNDPFALLEKIKSPAPTLRGFRYFNDHDPRMYDTFMADPKCAKIILSRNPVDCYVSLKIAKKTGQWKLTNATKRNEALAEFDAESFNTFLDETLAYYQRLTRDIQVSGQSAFFVNYNDLRDVDIINGIGRFLGVGQTLEKLSQTLKPQNPQAVIEKVKNPEDMALHLANHDYFGVARNPNFEPTRHVSIPSFVASSTSKILLMPVPSSANEIVLNWMRSSDEDELITGFTQKTFREWQQANQGYKSITVVRHPLKRAFHAFCERILFESEKGFPRFRNKLAKDYGLNLPKSGQVSDLPVDDLRHLFSGFLDFLKANLRGQTPLRVDGNWSSQHLTISAMAQIVPPDFVIRETELKSVLSFIANTQGYSQTTFTDNIVDPVDLSFDQIYDQALEAKAKAIYTKDYEIFGFGDYAA